MNTLTSADLEAQLSTLLLARNDDIERELERFARQRERHERVLDKIEAQYAPDVRRLSREMKRAKQHG